MVSMLCCRVPCFNERYRFLPETGFFAEPGLAPASLLASAADKVANLPWRTRRFSHDFVMVWFR